MLDWDIKSIPNLWLNSAEKKPDDQAIIHWDVMEGKHTWHNNELISAALLYTKFLIDNDIKKNDVCAVIIRHNPDFYPIYFAIGLIGAIPAILAYPNRRLHADKFRHGLSGMAMHSGLDWILTEKELEDIVTPLISTQKNKIKGIIYPLTSDKGNIESSKHNDYLKACNANLLTIDKNSPFLLQHSSGTTGLQKAVVLSHHAIIRHIQEYSSVLGISNSDKVVSWLPLYHDMGLIAAFHLPLICGIPTVQIDPFQWVSMPELLIEVISKESGTITWLPNFAYDFMSDRIDQDDIEQYNLRSLRLVINCSEPIRAESHEKFFTKFESLGLQRSSLSSCYALAEATFAVTQTSHGAEAKKLNVNRDLFSKNIVEVISSPQSAQDNIRSCVSSGKILPSCQVKIIDETNNELQEKKIGEIVIQSASLFNEYRNAPQKTSSVLKDDWFYTGDMGFLLDDECYVIGRKDNLIICAGKNVYPEDIEDVISEVPHVIPGRVVAFGIDRVELGTQTICAIVETSIDKDKQKDLKGNIKRACMSIDISISDIYLVPARWLIKSSSGKPSRNINKKRILRDEHEKHG